MKITICGSIAFHDEMIEAKEKLESLGHEVKIPQIPEGNDAWIESPMEKEEAIRTHFDKVAWSEAILVLNHDKKGVEGYVGANTLIEMGLALYLGKKIYLLNPIPDISYKEEIFGMKPEVVHGNFELIIL